MIVYSIYPCLNGTGLWLVPQSTVFIHPVSGEEYALARTERKSGKGHTGFIVHSSPEISLQQDLQRRDLTINAIAEGQNGELIDPCEGQQDLENRILRHISPAFSEDPLRVLRVARFAARFWSMQFTIAPETIEIMKQISSSGELSHLSKERIWQETQRALQTRNPEVYFLTLLQTGALQQLAPDLANSLNNQDNQKSILKLGELQSVESRYVALNLLASKEENGFSIETTNAINETLVTKRSLLELSTLSAKYIYACNSALDMSGDQIILLLQKLDGFRRTERCTRILICMQDTNTLLKQTGNNSIEFLLEALPKLRAIRLDTELQRDLDGKEISEALFALRKEKVDQLRQKRIK